MKAFSKGFWFAALAATAGAVFAAGAGPAAARGYPSRSVTMIMPYAVGSSTDVMARALAQGFQERLGQSFVVSNREGASGVVGMTLLTQSPPDGHTIAYTPLTPITIQPHLVSGTPLGPDL